MLSRNFDISLWDKPHFQGWKIYAPCPQLKIDYANLIREYAATWGRAWIYKEESVRQWESPSYMCFLSI